MSRINPATKAAQPPAGYQRPELVDLDHLVVRVTGEGGRDLGEYSFAGVSGPRPLLRSLVLGFATATGPGGRWRTEASIRTAHANLMRFYRDLIRLAPDICRIEQMTPDLWLQWRAELLEVHKWPGQVNNVRALLHDTPDVPEATRRALWRRNPKPKHRLVVDSYSKSEFNAVKAAAWRTVNLATARIRRNVTHLHDYREALAAGRDMDRVTSAQGRVLDHLARTGDLPRLPGGQRKSMPRGVVLEEGHARAHDALFLTTEEVLAFMVLFAAHLGYNASTIEKLRAKHQRPDGGIGAAPVHNIELEKARRPSHLRHTNDNLVDQGPESGGGIYARALELTQPARDSLTALGTPTDRLLIAKVTVARGGASPFLLSLQRGPIAISWVAKQQLLSDDGGPLKLTLQRVRLTEQTLNRQPRMNSQDVHDNVYVLPDRRAADDSVDSILDGQTDALEHARVAVAMRTWTADDLERARHDPAAVAQELGIERSKLRSLLAGGLDTPLAACVDFDHSPVSGGGRCTASFLLCLACPNAVATPEHLVRIVCLHDALEALGSALDPKVWNLDYADHFARIRQLLATKTTPAQQEAARSQVSFEDRERIEAMLARRFDA